MTFQATCTYKHKGIQKSFRAKQKENIPTFSCLSFSLSPPSLPSFSTLFPTLRHSHLNAIPSFSILSPSNFFPSSHPRNSNLKVALRLQEPRKGLPYLGSYILHPESAPGAACPTFFPSSLQVELSIFHSLIFYLIPSI